MGGAAYGGIYVYKNRQKSVLPSPIPSNSPVLPPTNQVVNPASPSPQPQLKIVTAGLGTDSGLAFNKYQLELPQGWTDDHQYENTGTPVDTLNLANGAYKIKIFQAATGGALCLYPGDPDFEGPSSRFDNFINLSTKDGVSLKRSGTNAYSGSSRGFTVCQKSSDGSYQQPTGFGHMSLTTPIVPDPTKLEEIDQIISSLKKI